MEDITGDKRSGLGRRRLILVLDGRSGHRRQCGTERTCDLACRAATATGRGAAIQAGLAELYPKNWRATNRPRTKVSPIAGPWGRPTSRRLQAIACQPTADGAAALRALNPRPGFLPNKLHQRPWECPIGTRSGILLRRSRMAVVGQISLAGLFVSETVVRGHAPSGRQQVPGCRCDRGRYRIASGP